MSDSFDYKALAASLKSQAKGFLPDDMKPEDSAYIENKLYDFSMLAGEALVNDNSLNLSNEQMEFAVQAIAEWTFHKSIDLIRAKISEEMREPILSAVCFAIFEISKQQADMDMSEVLEKFETNVNKIYTLKLKELFVNKVISKKIYEDALSQSNIDKIIEDARSQSNADEMTEEFVENKNVPVGDDDDEISTPGKKSNQISISNIVENIKNFFSTCFCPQKELTKLNNEIEDIRQEMQELVNPDKNFERLGVDELCLQVGCNLLSIADPDQEGQLLVKIAALRQCLTDELGYVIPNCRIQDCAALEPNEYVISVRNSVAARGYVYPDKYMVSAEAWDETEKPIPEDAIIGVDPTSQVQVYWISKADALLAEEEDITFTLPVDVIKTHLKDVVIKYVDQILTTDWVYKYMDHVKETEYGEKIINSLLEKIDVDDIRKIFVNLIREKVSIKDIMFVFERLCSYTKISNEPDILSEYLRAELSRQICMGNADETQVLYVLELSKTWEVTLDDSRQKSEIGTVFFKLEPEQVQDLIETTAMTLKKAQQSFCQQPVILCPPEIRLPLYRLLERHIPTIVVISYSELITDIMVEAVDTIEKI